MIQAEDGIRDTSVTGVQTCALPIFAEPHDTRVFTTNRIANEGGAVTTVYHDLDGGWQFVDYGPKEREDAALVHLGHVVGADPTVVRSEERRVGKECRWRWSPDDSSRRRHTRYIGDWSSDVCSSDLCRAT